MDETETKLLQITAGDLIPELSGNPNLLHVKQTAFSHWDAASGQEFQVQITVTRDEADFLKDFQTEELSKYQKL